MPSGATVAVAPTAGEKRCVQVRANIVNFLLLAHAVRVRHPEFRKGMGNAVLLHRLIHVLVRSVQTRTLHKLKTLDMTTIIN